MVAERFDARMPAIMARSGLTCPRIAPHALSRSRVPFFSVGNRE
ncbi:MAG: hypothetical protein OJF49_003092 [Ktedonobacterales bacterium]|nr:MAG: hypothetical protein OJF49_003092 [Ktedonobacterales bacterium]